MGSSRSVGGLHNARIPCEIFNFLLDYVHVFLVHSGLFTTLYFMTSTRLVTEGEAFLMYLVKARSLSDLRSLRKHSASLVKQWRRPPIIGPFFSEACARLRMKMTLADFAKCTLTNVTCQTILSLSPVWSVKPSVNNVPGVSKPLKAVKFSMNEALALLKGLLVLCMVTGALVLAVCFLEQLLLTVGRSGIQEFVGGGRLQLANYTANRRRRGLESDIKYTGRLAPTVKCIRQGLEENDLEKMQSISDFLCSFDGHRFLRHGHRDMRRLCYFRGELYRKCFVKPYAFRRAFSFFSIVSLFLIRFDKALTDYSEYSQIFFLFLHYFSAIFFPLLALAVFCGITQ